MRLPNDDDKNEENEIWSRQKKIKSDKVELMTSGSDVFNHIKLEFKFHIVEVEMELLY